MFIKLIAQHLEDIRFYFADIRRYCSHSTTIIAKRMWWMTPILAMALIFYLFYRGAFPLQGKDLGERGQFGDSFGVLNSLFTGLGFGGLIVTLILQQKQISHQERESSQQRRSEEKRHYEETLHRLLGLYSKTLDEIASKKTNLRGRDVLRGSIDRTFEAIKREKAHLIPQDIQHRNTDCDLTEHDRKFLDFLYFRNFKILSVELDRQGRLVDTLKVLLRHLVHEAPDYLLIRPYCDLICAQISYIEVSYTFLVALAFTDEDELRDLFFKSGLIEKAAHVQRLKIHDYMYEEFWKENVRQHKTSTTLPMSERRINEAIQDHRRRGTLSRTQNLTTYTSPRAYKHGIVTDAIVSGPELS